MNKPFKAKKTVKLTKKWEIPFTKKWEVENIDGVEYVIPNHGTKIYEVQKNLQGLPIGMKEIDLLEE
jgi:hypothetical protein